MTLPRYVVPTPETGQVAGRYLGSAILPAFTRERSSYQSTGKVYGSPGTAPIPAPPPGVGVFGRLARRAMGGLFDSADAPNMILPSQYYENDAPADKEHAPVQYLSVDHYVNVLPSPAIRPQNLIIADPFRAHVGGSRQIFQPQVVPVWLGRNGTTNG